MTADVPPSLLVVGLIATIVVLIAIGAVLVLIVGLIGSRRGEPLTDYEAAYKQDDPET